MRLTFALNAKQLENSSELLLSTQLVTTSVQSTLFVQVFKLYSLEVLTKNYHSPSKVKSDTKRFKCKIN